MDVSTDSPQQGRREAGEVRPLMQEAMQSHFSVFRRGDTLQQGLDKLIALRDPLEEVTVDDNSLLWNVALVSASSWPTSLNRRWSLHIPPVSARSHVARMRVRTITNGDDKNWLKHTVAWKDEDWKVTFAYRPVHLNALVE